MATQESLTEVPLDAALKAEFTGKSKDHVVTADSNPQLMALFVAEAVKQAEEFQKTQ